MADCIEAKRKRLLHSVARGMMLILLCGAASSAVSLPLAAAAVQFSVASATAQLRLGFLSSRGGSVYFPYCQEPVNIVANVTGPSNLQDPTGTVSVSITGSGGGAAPLNITLGTVSTENRNMATGWRIT